MGSRMESWQWKQRPPIGACKRERQCPSCEPIKRGVLLALVTMGKSSWTAQNMDCGTVQAVERVVGATCASAEERYKGRLNYKSPPQFANFYKEITATADNSSNSSQPPSPSVRYAAAASKACPGLQANIKPGFQAPPENLTQSFCAIQDNAGFGFKDDPETALDLTQGSQAPKTVNSPNLNHAFQLTPNLNYQGASLSVPSNVIRTDPQPVTSDGAGFVNPLFMVVKNASSVDEDYDT
uniref:(California timema) hypothetical protein n=1 Tax=Timema californicum TaxID=61474 RepID=A0A7R9IVX6_TIMCA|nr:unnamed protein product [Timema californicum]